MRLLRYALVGALLSGLASPTTVAAQAGRVILVRHAEKVDASRDPELSAAGMARAMALAEVLDSVQVDAVLVSQFRRTGLTAAPTAAEHNIKPEVVAVQGSASDYGAALAARIRQLPRNWTVLVVGHSNTLGPTIAALGGPRVEDLCDSEYTRLFDLDLSGDDPRLTETRYGDLTIPEGASCPAPMAPLQVRGSSTSGAPTAMTPAATLSDLVGEWTGDNKLWVIPGEPVRESATAARVSLVAGGRYLVLDYTWAEGGKPQDGHLVVRLASDTTDVDMVWVDSWHQGASFLRLAGIEKSSASVSALGSYAAPPGPAWGWRIAFTAESKDRYAMRMWNITPDGQELLAVEAVYKRN